MKTNTFIYLYVNNDKNLYSLYTSLREKVYQRYKKNQKTYKRSTIEHSGLMTHIVNSAVEYAKRFNEDVADQRTIARSELTTQITDECCERLWNEINAIINPHSDVSFFYSDDENCVIRTTSEHKLDVIKVMEEYGRRPCDFGSDEKFIMITFK